MGTEQVQGRGGSISFQHPVAKLAQRVDAELPHRRPVLDHEHNFLVLAERQVGRPILLTHLGRSPGQTRQVDLHRRPLPALRIDSHVPSRLLNEPVNLREAQPRALTHLLRGEKRVEGSHARACRSPCR